MHFKMTSELNSTLWKTPPALQKHPAIFLYFKIIEQGEFHLFISGQGSEQQAEMKLYSKF